MTDPVINLYDTLPSWSNDENRHLHALILKKTSELTSLQREAADMQERVSLLKNHLKSVQSEVATTQQLLAAKQSQAEQEKHLQQVCEREHGKIVSDMAALEQQTQEIMAKVDNLASRIVIGQRRINQFKEEARMNQEELEQWILVARQKEEDFLVLQRYHREDESRVRTMLVQIEKATDVIESKRGELDRELMQTRGLQIELDMTAAHFRKMHADRAELLTQWEGTLRQMQALNDAIEKTTKALEERKVEVEKLRAGVSEETRALDLAESENARIERQMGIQEHQVLQGHKVLERESAELVHFTESVETQRHALEKLESDARFFQAEIENCQRMTAQENGKKEAMLQRLQETRNALLVQRDQTGELNMQTDLMNDFLKNEESLIKSLDQAIDNEKNQIFKLSQDLYKARQNERNLISEVEGSQRRGKSLAQKIHEFDREAQKQMELLYSSKAQIQQLERKIARIEGDRTQEETQELQAQMDQLNRILDGKLETEKTLCQQLQRLESDIRQTSRRREALEKAKSDFAVKLNDVRLDQDSLDKSTARARTQKETLLVQLNMLRLQVEKVSSQVATRTDELLSLENRRQQLQLSMEERVQEIDGHLTALRTQLKTEEEARHQAAIEVQERKRRAETLQSKYEVIMGKYRIDGEEASHTSQLMRFAEERERVNARGDELQEQVRLAIKELRAVEREAEKLNGGNAQFRASFNSARGDDSETERKKVLEEQLRGAQQRLNARRAEAQTAIVERKRMEQTYEQQQAMISQMQNEIGRMKPVVEKTAAENKELGDKIRRANHMLVKAREGHRKATNVPLDAKYPASMLEMDLELRMARSTIETAVAELTSIAERNRDIEPKLRSGLAQIGLIMKQLSPTLAHVKVPPIVTPLSSARGSGSIGSGRSVGSIGSGRSRGSVASKSSVQNLQFPQ
jgi:chromosome segregation ATPase